MNAYKFRSKIEVNCLSEGNLPSKSRGERRLEEMQASHSEGTTGRTALDSLIGYVRPRLDQMNYPSCRDRDMVIGSGAVESAGKQLVVLRAKGPGMHWTADGLEAVLALRAMSLNRNWEAFWKTQPQRVAA